MLASGPEQPNVAGSLDTELHAPGTFRHQLLSFIASELPKWRDRPDRPIESTETVLSSQLCAHLNAAARLSDGWDVLQFRPEERDEANAGRKIDIVPAPCGTTICIEGRRHTDFDAILPIECKRLPIPKGSSRDEREYVFSKYSSTGGIQRFKSGVHASAHRLGSMIAYVQAEATEYWETRISGWITELADAEVPGWSRRDRLHFDRKDSVLRMSWLHSMHDRENGLSAIELRHFWIEMN